MTDTKKTRPGLAMVAAVASLAEQREETGGAVEGSPIAGTGWPDTIEGSGSRDMQGSRQTRAYDPTEADVIVLFTDQVSIADGDTEEVELAPEGEVFVCEKLVAFVGGDSHDEIEVLKATVSGLQFFGSSQMPKTLEPFKHDAIGNEFRSPPITSKKPAKIQLQNNNGGGTARTVYFAAYGKGNRTGGS